MARPINVTFKNTERDRLIKTQIEKHSNKSGYLKDLVWEDIQRSKVKHDIPLKSELDDELDDVVMNIID